MVVVERWRWVLARKDLCRSFVGLVSVFGVAAEVVVAAMRNR